MEQKKPSPAQNAGYFINRLRPVLFIQHVKASPVVGKIDKTVFHWDSPDVTLLKKAEQARGAGVFPGEFDGGRADIDRNDIESFLDQEHGVMPGTRSKIQGLSDRDFPAFNQAHQIGIRAAGVPRQLLHLGGQITVFPILRAAHWNILTQNRLKNASVVKMC